MGKKSREGPISLKLFKFQVDWKRNDLQSCKTDTELSEKINIQNFGNNILDSALICESRVYMDTAN